MNVLSNSHCISLGNFDCNLFLAKNKNAQWKKKKIRTTVCCVVGKYQTANGVGRLARPFDRMWQRLMQLPLF